MIDKKPISPFQINNIRHFIAFRIFFTSRFYYPVFTILFLDFGLSLEQFALLNVVWAVTIVIFEVPSGALADVIGRRNLLIIAGGLMVFEMALLCFVPMGNTRLLFGIFLINRFLSGLAEASASGADEALAYDSLMKEGNIDDWGRVLEKQMRYASIGFIGAMSLGAVVYDPDSLNWIANRLGYNTIFHQDLTLRFPLFLTLIMAILALITTFKMREIGGDNNLECSTYESCKTSIVQGFKLTLKAGKWILATPYALVIILAVMIFDHIIRMVMTLDSQYLRLIHFPEATFGVIGSAISVMGLFTPKIALILAERRTPTCNLFITFVFTFIGLLGMIFFIPFAGLVPISLVFGAYFLMNFFQSYYLNKITDSNQRATVLSFKGLSLNAAYGIIGLCYSIFLNFLRSDILESQPGISTDSLDREVFIESIAWFPWYFLIMFIILLVFARSRIRNTNQGIG